jgi:hypothetical protein
LMPAENSVKHAKHQLRSVKDKIKSLMGK